MLNLEKYNYKIRSDINLFLDSEQINLDGFSKLVDISRTSLYSLMKIDKTTNEVYEKIYSSIRKKGFNINEIKEGILSEEFCNNDEIILFHGSKNGLEKVVSDGSREQCDFGKGFYLSDNYEQAASFVRAYDNSSIYAFKLKNYSKLKTLKFEYNEDWLIAICFFRGTIERYKDNKKVKEIINKINNADIIIAPIADNRMFSIIDEFANGVINSSTAIEAMTSLKLGLQYVIKKEKALEDLIPIEKMYFCNAEKEEFKNKSIQRYNLAEDVLKEITRKRLPGKYIEEMFL